MFNNLKHTGDKTTKGDLVLYIYIDQSTPYKLLFPISDFLFPISYFLATGYIARYIWLYSQELYSQIYLAI